MCALAARVHLRESSNVAYLLPFLTSLCFETLIYVLSTMVRGEQTNKQTGCLGCASGKGAGPRNIFGNKYGQNLAAVQIAREKRMQAKAEALQKNQQEKEEEDELRGQQQEEGNEETDDSAETDDDEDDDYGPSPAAGIWAGSQQLQKESERIAQPDDAGEEETDDEEEERPSKKARAD